MRGIFILPTFLPSRHHHHLHHCRPPHILPPNHPPPSGQSFGFTLRWRLVFRMTLSMMMMMMTDRIFVVAVWITNGRRPFQWMTGRWTLPFSNLSEKHTLARSSRGSRMIRPTMKPIPIAFLPLLITLRIRRRRPRDNNLINPRHPRHMRLSRPMGPGRTAKNRTGKDPKCTGSKDLHV